MRTRLLTFMTLCLLSVSAVKAQWTYDLQIGITKNQITTDGAILSNGDHVPAKTNWGYGYRLGFIGRYVTKFNMTVGSGIAIGEERNEKVFGLASTGYYYNMELQHIEYFHVPLMLGYNINLGDLVIRPEVGVFGNYNFGGREIMYGFNNKNDIIDKDIKVNPFKNAGEGYYRSFERFDYGWAAGLTLQYDGIGLNLYYEKGKHKMGGDYLNVKTSLWSGSLVVSM